MGNCSPQKKPTSKSEKLDVCSECHVKCDVKRSPIPLITLFQLIKRDFQKYINKNSQYYFCKTIECGVVYFSSDPGDFIFKKEHLIVRVGQKEKAPSRHVCYCFDYTEENIRNEIKKTGKSTAMETISENIKNKLCACEIRNPQGSCCLGNVSEVVKKYLK